MKTTSRDDGKHIWELGEARSNLARQYVAVKAARERLAIEERDLLRALDRLKATRARLIEHLISQGLDEADAAARADMPTMGDGYERYPQLVVHAEEIDHFIGGGHIDELADARRER